MTSRPGSNNLSAKTFNPARDIATASKDRGVRRKAWTPHTKVRKHRDYVCYLKPSRKGSTVRVCQQRRGERLPFGRVAEMCTGVASIHNCGANGVVARSRFKSFLKGRKARRYQLEYPDMCSAGAGSVVSLDLPAAAESER